MLHVLACLQILHRDPGMERGGIKAMNLTADGYFMTVRPHRGSGRGKVMHIVCSVLSSLSWVHPLRTVLVADSACGRLHLACRACADLSAVYHVMHCMGHCTAQSLVACRVLCLQIAPPKGTVPLVGLLSACLLAPWWGVHAQPTCSDILRAYVCIPLCMQFETCRRRALV